MKSRLLVSALGIPLLLYVVLFAPPIALAVALCILAGVAGIELQRCVSGEKNSLMVWLSGAVATLAMVCCCVYPAAIATVFSLEVFVFFAFAIMKAGHIRFHQVMAALFTGTVVVYFFASFFRIDSLGLSRGYLMLPFVLSFMSDTGGYFVGRSFGKHKLAPKISPKKTVEGAIGGIAGNILGAVIFTVVMRYVFFEPIHWGIMILFSVLCSIVAQIGDLSFSFIKREFSIKDYGRLFLEHGGVLDRFDSVLFVAPLTEIMLNLML